METPPPNYSGYYRAAGPGGGGGRPGVYYEFITKSWQYIRPFIGKWMVISLCAFILMMLVSLATNLIGQSVFPSTFKQQELLGSLVETEVKSGPRYVLDFVFMILSGGLSMVVLTGMVLCGFDAMEGREPTFDRFTSVFSKFGQVFGTGLLASLAMYGGMMLCCVPGIYFMGLFAFAPLYSFVHNLAPMDAMRASSAALKPYAWSMFLVTILAVILAMLGVFALVIGLLVTYPIYPLTLAQHFRQFHPVVEPGAPAPHVGPTV